jgi:hypothetical protein
VSGKREVSELELNSLNFLFVRLHNDETFYNAFESCVGLKVLKLELGGQYKEFVVEEFVFQFSVCSRTEKNARKI